VARDEIRSEVQRLKALLAQKDELILSMRAEIDGLRLALEVMVVLLLLLLFLLLLMLFLLLLLPPPPLSISCRSRWQRSAKIPLPRNHSDGAACSSAKLQPCPLRAVWLDNVSRAAAAKQHWHACNTSASECLLSQPHSHHVQQLPKAF
jgi:hypothetical protein